MNDQAAAKYEAAIDLAIKGDRGGAARLLRELVEANADDQQSRCMLGKLLAESATKSQVSEGEDLLRTVIGSRDSAWGPPAMLELAGLLTDKRNVVADAEAESLYLSTIERGELRERSLAAYNLAMLYERQKRFDDREHYLAQAANAEDDRVSPHAAVQLGIRVEERGDLDMARSYYRLAIESKDPDESPLGAKCLGTLEAEEQNFDEARHFLRLAIDSGHPKFGPEAAERLNRLVPE